MIYKKLYSDDAGIFEEDLSINAFGSTIKGDIVCVGDGSGISGNEQYDYFCFGVDGFDGRFGGLAMELQ